MTSITKDTGPPSTSSRSTFFLGCFGRPGENMQVIDEVNSGSRRRRRRWISNWTFGCKKSDVKTVHIGLYSKSVNAAPAESDTKDGEALTGKDVIVVTPEEQKVRRRKWTDMVKRQNGSSRSRLKEAAGAGVESPVNKGLTMENTFVSSPLKPLTHSKSLPAFKNHKIGKDAPAGGGVDEGVVQKTALTVLKTKRLKPGRGTAAAGGGVDDEVEHKTVLTNSKSLPPTKTQKPRRATTVGGGVAHKARPRGEEIDSIIAMTILLAILVIMLLWGKLCAIICTSAWFFIAPRLVATREHSVVATTERQPPEPQLNLESVEYKKKVVLEGLLERKHRNFVVRL